MKKLRTIFVLISLLAVIAMLSACGGQGGWGEPQPENEALEPFDTSTLPTTVTDASAVTSFAFDKDGNLLFSAENAGELRSMNRETGAITTIATGLPTDHLRGVTANDDSIFVGYEGGVIYEIDPATGTVSTLVSILSGSYMNCLAIAPDTFDSYGGQLIAASDAGIFAVNLSTLAVVKIADAQVSSIVFGSDGTLYAALEDVDKIVTVTAAGVITDFATGLAGPDGITIDDAGGMLYVTNDKDGTIKSVTIPGGVVSTLFSGLSFSSGWAPSPIVYDAAGNLLLVGTGGNLTINYYDLNP